MKTSSSLFSRLHGSSLKSRRKVGLKQRGQALPVGLAFILVGMLGALVLFNTGQVAVDKQRLANAADSAAYSGMVWQARALNFQAYSNRAMVANQVSMGQATSLHSWADYAQQFTLNARTVFGWIPYVGTFISILESITNVVGTVAKAVAQGMVAVIAPINDAVRVAQEAVFASSYAATPDIVRDVAKASDDRFTADTAFSALGLTQSMNAWSEFTEEYNPDDDDLTPMQQRTAVVNESRDDFSKGRYWDFFDNFWVYSSPFTKHKVIREGETHFVMMEKDGKASWEWVAKDTVGFHTRIWRPFRSSKKIEAFMGWGAAYANSDGAGASKVLPKCESGALSGQDCTYRRYNSITERYADAAIAPLNNYTGIKGFRSLSKDTLELVDEEAVLRLKAEVSMDLDDVRSSDRYITDKAPFVTPMVGAGQLISSISVAEVYYRRPEAYDETTPEEKKLEAANGYNPYWDVRLAPVSSMDRLAAFGMRGDPGGGGVLPGGADAEALANYDPEAGLTTDPADPAAPVVTSALNRYESATVASVLGLPDGAASSIVSGAPATFVASAIDGWVDADSIKDDIQDSIEREVKEAALSFLKEAGRSAAQSVIESAAPGVLTTAADGLEKVEAAVAMADELTQKFETMRVEVQREFQAAMETKVGEYEAVLAPVLDELNRVGPLKDAAEREYIRVVDGYYYGGSESRGSYRRGYNAAHDQIVDKRARLRTELAQLQTEVRDLGDTLREDLTRTLIDSIEYHGRGFLEERMPWDGMSEITNVLLDEYLNEAPEDRGRVDVTELLPWGGDDEDGI